MDIGSELQSRSEPSADVGDEARRAVARIRSQLDDLRDLLVFENLRVDGAANHNSSSSQSAG